MDIVIRPAEPTDLEAVTAIEAACFPAAEAATEESFRQRLAAFTHSFLIAEKDGRPIGFINGCVTNKDELTDDLYESTALHDDDAPNVMVFGLDVIPQEQHQGFAAALMKAYIEKAESRRKKQIILTCKERLIPFYEQFGYECHGKSQSTHGGAVWYDMVLSLIR